MHVYQLHKRENGILYTYDIAVSAEVAKGYAEVVDGAENPDAAGLTWFATPAAGIQGKGEAAYTQYVVDDVVYQDIFYLECREVSGT